MRSPILMLTLAAATFLPQLSLARDGGSEGGGGGNRLIAEYVAVANSLLGTVAFTPEHKRLLKQALERAEFKTTKQLMDPVTRQPLAEQDKLIAWGSPGLVQLKEKGVLFQDSFEDALATARPIAHIVIHELFRASGALGSDGKSIDENFQLSIGKYHLEQSSRAATAIRVERGSQFLYAECKVVRCEHIGDWSRTEEASLCETPKAEPGSTGWMNGTLSVYKYAGIESANDKDGLFMVRSTQPHPEYRIGDETIDAVKIIDGEKGMEIVSDSNGSTYRNFRIEYSTRQKPITKGRLEISFSDRSGERWLGLDLGDCRTSQY